MINKNLETALFELLENYELEDVVFSLFRYADIQASLAKTLQQTEAAANWKHRAYELGSMRFRQSSNSPQMIGIQERLRGTL